MKTILSVLGFWVQLDFVNLSDEKDILISIKMLMPEERNFDFPSRRHQSPQYGDEARRRIS